MLRSTPELARASLFIDGAWRVPSAGGGAVDVLDAATEDVVARLPAAAPADVDAAVDAARRAFHGGWGATTGAARAVGNHDSK